MQYLLEALRLNPDSKNNRTLLLRTLHSHNWLFWLLRLVTLLLMFAVASISVMLALLLIPHERLQTHLQETNQLRTGSHPLSALAFILRLLAMPLLLPLQALFSLLEMTEASLISLTFLAEPTTRPLVLESDRKRIHSYFRVWQFLILLGIVCAAIWHNPGELMRHIRSHN